MEKLIFEFNKQLTGTRFLYLSGKQLCIITPATKALPYQALGDASLTPLTTLNGTKDLKNYLATLNTNL